MSGKQSIGVEISRWWKDHISPRVQHQPDDEAGKDAGEVAVHEKAKQTAARTLSARLRRGTYPAILFEREVAELISRLGLKEHQLKRFSQILNVVSTVRKDVSGTLAQQLKGAEEVPRMSPLRFKQLMTAENDELAAGLRRALVLADYKCNVAQLAQDMTFWNDRTRARWCLDYFADPPSEKTASNG